MNNNNILLSASVGRHRLGFAVFKYGDPIYYGMTTLKQFHTEQQLREAVYKFLEKTETRYKIGALVIRGLNKQQRRNRLLVAIVDQVGSYCLKNHLLLSMYGGRHINEQFCEPAKRPTKEKTIQAVISKYPHLRRYYDSSQAGKMQYYVHLFHAIAVGVVHLKNTKNA